MKRASLFPIGFLLGVISSYYLDPVSGRRRRALTKDRFVSVSSKLPPTFGAAGRDLAHELKGIVAGFRSWIRHEPVSDQVLVERVRAKLGRAVSHPRAIEVLAQDGSVVLLGAVLADEFRGLLSAVESIQGVREVHHELEVHESGANVPSLQGDGRRPSSQFEMMQSNWSPAFRHLSAGVACGLLVFGFRGKMTRRAITLPTASLLLLRAITNTELKRLVGIGAGRRAVDVHKTLHIDLPVDEVYSFWKNFKNFPEFMPHLREVRELDDARSHWVAYGPGHTTFEWTSVVTRADLNSLLAWKSEPGSSVPNAGVVKFTPNRWGGTQVDIQMSYNPPGGMLGDAIATLLRRDLKTALDQGLLRLKSLLEEGKATARGRTVTLDDVARNEAMEITH